MTCCAVATNGSGGINVGGSIGGGSGAGNAGGGGILDRIARALDTGIHGGDSGSVVANSAQGSAARGGNVIDFPMVNPYRPLLQTRVPVAGLNAFPRVNDVANIGYRVDTFNARGERDDPLPADTESLGFLDPSESLPSGIGLPRQPSNLQLILGTIASTLPATISALKKQPYYAPGTGTQYSTPGYTTEGGYNQPGANIGAQAGAAVGNVGDTISNIVAQHPLLVLAGGAALVLLFMSPPRRR